MNIAPLKVSLLSLALLLSPVASLPAHAACTANLALQPASSLPALGGRLVYHSYMEYGTAPRTSTCTISRARAPASSTSPAGTSRTR